MKRKGKKGVINFSSAITYKIVLIAVGLILPKLFITTYGSEINGFQTSVKQIFTYIALLEAGIGASTLQSLYRPVANNNKNQVNAYLAAASKYYNKIGVLYFIILFVMGIIYTFAIPVTSLERIEVFIYIMVSGAFTGINFFYVTKLKILISAEGDQYIVSLITMVTFTISSIIKIICITMGIHIIIVELGYLAINVASTFMYYLLAKRKYPWISFKEKPDYTCIEQSNSVMVHKITSLVFQNVDVLLLTVMCDLEVVSIYSMYKLVVNMVTSVVSEIGNSINFIFGQQFNRKETVTYRYIEIIDVYNVYYSAIAFGLYTVAYILIIPFMRIYTDGMDINYIYTFLPAIYIIIEFLIVGRDAMMRTIEVAGHFKKTQKSAIIEMIINLTASIALIIMFKTYMGDVGGLYGALLGTVIALIYRTIDINIYSNKHILNRTAKKSVMVMVTNIVLFAITVIIVKDIDFKIASYIEFIKYGAIITFVIVILFIIVHSLVNINEFKAIYKILKGKGRHAE